MSNFDVSVTELMVKCYLMSELNVLPSSHKMNAFTVPLGENVLRAKSEPAPNQCTNVDG